LVVRSFNSGPAQHNLEAPFVTLFLRQLLSQLTGCDLIAAPMEVNVFHYGPGANLGPHSDLEDKLVTHILYFNPSWDREDGGCLTILRSADPADIAAEVDPIVGNSAVVVRSERNPGTLYRAWLTAAGYLGAA